MFNFFFPRSMAGVRRSSLIFIIVFALFTLHPFFDQKLSMLNIVLFCITLSCVPINFYYQYAVVRSGGNRDSLRLPLVLMNRPWLQNLLGGISILGQLLIVRFGVLIVIYIIKIF